MVADEVEAGIASIHSQTKSSDVGPIKNVPESHITYKNQVVVSGCDSQELLLVDPPGWLSCRGRGSATICSNDNAEWDLVAKGAGVDRIGQLVWNADIEFVGRFNDRGGASSVVDVPERHVPLKRDVVFFLRDQFGLKSRVHNVYPNEGTLQFCERSFGDSRGIFGRRDGSPCVMHLAESENDKAEGYKRQCRGRDEKLFGVESKIPGQSRGLSKTSR